MTADDLMANSRTPLEYFCKRHRIRASYLARQCGCSLTLVYEMFNGRRRVTPKTWSRLLPALQRHTTVALSVEDFAE